MGYIDVSGSLDPEYAAFLASRTPAAKVVGFEPMPMRACMDGFRAMATRTCIKRGRSALFLSTGLGKTSCELEWAEQCAVHSGRPSLILTPLAVARQMEREATRFGYPARVIREQSDLTTPIAICNYDRLDKLDVSRFGAVALDESSILRNFTGATSNALIQQFAGTSYRLCATATPAPNDHMELGQHAAFLGIMPSNEMLMRWFIADQTQMGRYRLKGHAVTAFWDWMASWAVMADSPEDLGFDGSAFVLPEMQVVRHRVQAETKPTDGLFGFDVSATAIHTLKRQTASVRAEMAAALVAAEPDESWLIWVDTDYEAKEIKSRIPNGIEVRGSMSIAAKEDVIAAFGPGSTAKMISKPSILGAGLNFQHCARTIFVGRSFSFEAYYQAVRRCWRFGQARQVQVHLIVAEGEEQIGRVISRKADDHAKMQGAMRAAQRRALDLEPSQLTEYRPTHKGRLPSWL